MQADEVKTVLQQALPECEVTVEADGNHYAITVVGDLFEGMRPVKRQQTVYAAINQHIADGSMHAVHIKAMTVQEAQ